MEGTSEWYQYRDQIYALVVEEGVTTLGTDTFMDLYRLCEVTLPQGLVSIGDGAFMICEELVLIDIPDTVTSIGENAFVNCSALVQLTIPASVTTISASTSSYSPFYNGSSSLQIFCEASSKPTGWDSYWNYVWTSGTATCTFGATRKDADFWSTVDRNAESIVIPEGVTIIPANAFDGNTTLKGITIPSTVKTIGGYAFRNCNNLHTIIFDHVAGDPLTICGQTVQSKALSFRVTQSKLKVTVPKTVTIYQYQSVPVEVPLQVAAPAEIWYLTLGSKTTAGLKEAIGEVTLTEDNRVLLQLADPAKLTPGKSYTLYLNVTPVNNAENVVPTQVKVNIKVSK